MAVNPNIYMPTYSQLKAAVKSTINSQQGTPCPAPSPADLEGAVKFTLMKGGPGDVPTETAYLTNKNDLFEEIQGGFFGGDRWLSFGQGPVF